MARRRHGPVTIASALVRATTKAVAGASLELVEEASTSTGKVLARGSSRVAGGLGVIGRRLVAGELGIGPVRVRERDVEWVRRQVAAGLRALLLVPEDTAERLRAADPTAMARTVLALVGAEEALVPLPSTEEQIAQRFRALLDDDVDDPGSLAPALLTITAQLSPDEARILRHLASAGSAVVVSVESTTLTSRRGPTVARHLSLLVERSGGDHPEQGPAYVADLVRLGLCVVDEETDGDDADVEVVVRSRAHAVAAAGVRAAGRRPRTVVGALRLTELGRQLVAIGIGDRPAVGPVGDEPPPVPGAQAHPPVPRVRVERPRDDARWD